MQDLPHRYTIGQLAGAVGVAPSAVRFYDRSGLLRPDGRTEGNYRVYGDAALERLRFIRAAQANGFTLEDIAALLAFRDGAPSPCRDVRRLIADRLADLDRRAREVRRLRTVLRAWLARCLRGRDPRACPVIEGLDRVAATPSKPLPPRPGVSRSPRPPR